MTAVLKHDRWTRYAVVTAASIVVFLAPTAGAQVFYAYPGAPPVKKDQPAVGATIGFGDDLFRMLGYGRFNVSEVSDLGIEIVVDNTDVLGGDVWRGGLAADFKYAIVPKETTMPFDLSVDAGLGYEWGGSMNNFEIPIGGMVSRPLELRGGGVIVPYGGVYILIRYTSIDLPAGVPGDDDDWDVDVELRGGTGYRINQASMAFATLHLGAGTKFYLGVNFLL
jgi:hypothetical protein